jgi:DUF4097 and DUF4098 domain-containing protein YvlB
MTAGPREFPADRPITAVVRVGSGAVTIVGEDRPSAQVLVEAYDASEASINAADGTHVELRGEELIVEAPETKGNFLIRRSGRVRVTVRVPLDTNVRVRTGSADTVCEGRLGEVSINSGSGDTRVAETSGDLSLNTGSGDLRAEVIGGVLRVNGASGDVQVARARSDVNANLASGDLAVEDAAGQVRVTTASGDIALGTVRGEKVHVNSASGDVVVGVLAGTLVWLDLSTVSGSTTSELDMTDQGPPKDAPSSPMTLQVRTMSGDIHVRRVYAPQVA